MAKVKVNYAEFESVQEHIEKAKSIMEDIVDVWGQNFDNLYNNFITNGFLEDLYKDAESQYYNLANAGYVISYTGTGFGTGAAIGAAAGSVIPGLGNIAVGLIGGIIGAVIGFFCGIKHCVKNPTEIKWCYDSKIVFENLLYNCALGDDDSFTAIANTDTKIEQMLLALFKIKTKINEFSQLYANLNATAVESGIKTVLADDKVTLLGVETGVVIDGQTVYMNTSEALNAFYTYSNTIMSTEISADYLHRTYGYEINYNDIVKNANGFMTNTISSGLYTHEFILGVLPTYNPSLSAAYNAVTGATGVDLDKIQSTLNNSSLIAGEVALFGGLLGGALIGKIASTTPSQSSNPSNIGGGNGGGGSTNIKPNITPEVKPNTTPEVKPEETVKPSNEVKIDSPVDSKLPEKVEFTNGNSTSTENDSNDFDEEARQKFEFEGEYENKISHRDELIADVDNKFDAGDFESLRKQLKEYGYSDDDIELILQDKLITMKAIVVGEQNVNLATQAKELAKLAGLEDFNSKYDIPLTYKDLVSEEPSKSFMLASEDSNVTNLYNDMKESKEAYKATIAETNSILSEAGTNKTAMDEIFNKYSKEFGSDTTKWTESAALEYKDAVDKYNTSVNDANKQMDKLNESKDKYLASRDEFEKAREKYYNDSIENYKKSKNESEGNTGVPVNSAEDIEKQIENSISFDDNSIVINTAQNNDNISGVETITPDIIGNDISQQIANSINIAGDSIEIQ